MKETLAGWALVQYDCRAEKRKRRDAGTWGAGQVTTKVETRVWLPAMATVVADHTTKLRDRLGIVPPGAFEENTALSTP